VIEYCRPRAWGDFHQPAFDWMRERVQEGHEAPVHVDPDYLDHMRLCNGGPTHSEFDAVGQPDRLLQFLYHYAHIDWEDESIWDDPGMLDMLASTAWTQAWESDAFHYQLWPIGELFAGDMVCFDYRSTPQSPPIVLWLHDQSRVGHPKTAHVADTFREFAEMLRPSPES
jgi:hypothetical protein